MCEGEVSDLFPVYSFNQLWNKRQETGMELFKLWMPEDELYEQNYLGGKKREDVLNDRKTIST